MPSSDVTEHRDLPRRRVVLAVFAAVAVVPVLFFLVATTYINRLQVQRRIQASIEDAGGSSWLCYQVSGGFKSYDPPPGPSFVRALFGDDAFAKVTVVEFCSPSTADGYIENLPQLPELKDVYLNGPRINDGCIEALLRIRHLRALGLRDTTISVHGISTLAASRSLQELTLNGRWVSNQHLEELARFPNLNSLRVDGTSITDPGVVTLGRISSLRSLQIYPGIYHKNPPADTGVTDVGVAGLKGLADLEFLAIYGFALTDSSLVAIGELPRLRRVWLSGQFTGEGIRQLKAKLPECNVEYRTSEADDSEKADALSGSGEQSLAAESR